MASVEFLGHIFDEKGIMMSSTRIQGIHDLPEPTSVKSVRSFVGMANYFRDFISGLSTYIIPLTMLTKKRYTSEAFELTEAARNAFYLVKDLLAKSAKRANMNPDDPLILYTDASMKAVGGVLMQVQDGREQPCVFVSHTLSEQASGSWNWNYTPLSTA
jgi:hypothetical protein